MHIYHILGMVEHRCPWPRGKVLGGSSVLNYMLYVRGNKKDYDRWEELGNPGWGYKDVFPYFKKSEDNRDANFMNTPYHSTGGYLTVSKSPYATPISNIFIEGGKEMGYEIRDFNGEFQTAFINQQGNFFIKSILNCNYVSLPMLVYIFFVSSFALGANYKYNYCDHNQNTVK